MHQIPHESREILSGSVFSRAEFVAKLVKNSIVHDARHVRVFLKPQLAFTVQDDGRGEQEIHKLGLRRFGQTLANLCAVSIVTIKTCGRVLTVEGESRVVEEGNKDDSTPSAGLSVSSTALFYNIPVKRKWALQQKDYDNTVLALWTLATLHPQVEITLVSQTRTQMVISATNSVSDRCQNMLEYYGNVSRAVQLTSGCSDLSITGAIARKSSSRSSKRRIQLLFYNHKQITMKRIQKQLAGYNYVLSVESDASEGLSKEIEVDEMVSEFLDCPGTQLEPSGTQQAQKRKHRGEVESDGSEGSGYNPAGDSAYDSDGLDGSPESSVKLTRFNDFSFVAQLNRKFILILAQMDTPVLVCVDQHAAHERILADNYAKKLAQEAALGTAPSAEIVPLFLSLDVKKALFFKPQLEAWGFEFEGGYVSRVPALAVNMDPRDLDEALTEYMEMLESRAVSQTAVPPFLQTLIAALACRNAIKFGDELTNHECQRLVGDLLRCTLPFQCAHGRPSMVPLALV